MRRYFTALLLLAGALPLTAQAPYRTPPPDVVAILDAPPLPVAIVSPDRTAILLVEQRAMPTVAELARPWLRLAGYRINARNNGPRQPRCPRAASRRRPGRRTAGASRSR